MNSASLISDNAFTMPCFTIGNRLARALWGLVYVLLFRPSPRPCHGWRAFLLRAFGAKLGPHTFIYPRAVIWAPWNLRCGDYAAIANDAEVYNPSPIELGDYVTVSQGAYLCGASHDYRSWKFPLITKPIRIESHAWIAARAIVHMGVNVAEGCLIGAGSVVTRDMPAWTVCGGNPCRTIKSYSREGDRPDSSNAS